MPEKIVVTGIGMVSPLGSDVGGAVQAITARRSGVAHTERFGKRRYCGTVANFAASDYMHPNKARRMDAINCFTIATGKLALKHACLDDSLRKDCGLIVGTGFSGFHSVVEHQTKFLRDGIRNLTPIHFPTTVYNASAGVAAIELGVAGPNSTVTSVDVSGEFAILYGWMLLRRGMTERVLVVGADEISSALLEGFDNLRLTSDADDAPPYPFAKTRRGFALGEGAAALLLETENAAAQRGATMLATIEGIGVYSAATNPFSHNAEPEAGKAAIKQALERADRRLEDIDWVSSAANASRTLDHAEIALWKDVLSNATTKLAAIKAYTGEFASSGVLRLALGIACAQRGTVPVMDEDIEYADPVIAARLNRETKPQAASRFLHHGTGVGGNNVSMVIGGSRL